MSDNIEDNPSFKDFGKQLEGAKQVKNLLSLIAPFSKKAKNILSEFDAFDKIQNDFEEISKNKNSVYSNESTLFFWWSCALNIRTRDSERIVPRNVESQYELTSFVPIIVHINRVDKRVDDTPLILNIFYITPLERFEPIHDSLLRQEGLFHFLPSNLPFEVSALFFQLLKTLLRCW